MCVCVCVCVLVVVDLSVLFLPAQPLSFSQDGSLFFWSQRGHPLPHATHFSPSPTSNSPLLRLFMVLRGYPCTSPQNLVLPNLTLDFSANFSLAPISLSNLGLPITTA